jgi:hypothetical protein
MTSNSEKHRRRALVKAKEAQLVREARKALAFKTRVGVDSWFNVLEELDLRVMASVRRSEEHILRFKKLYPGAIELLACGTMLRPGASSVEIQMLEARLGLTLPRGYVEFLRASNGLLLPQYCKFASTDEIITYEEADPLGADALDDYLEDVEEPRDEEYKRYGGKQDPLCIRAAYARKSLALNCPVTEQSGIGQDFGWVLLVHEIKFESGEYEVWNYDPWASKRYEGFAAYFKVARKMIDESSRMSG